MTLGHYIRTQRKVRQMTSTELARKLGVSLSFVSDFEQGRRQSVRFVPQMAAVLQVDRDYLYYLAGQWPPDLQDLTEEQVSSIYALLRGA